jgi:hypothetical protein
MAVVELSALKDINGRVYQSASSSNKYMDQMTGLGVHSIERNDWQNFVSSQEISQISSLCLKFCRVLKGIFLEKKIPRPVKRIGLIDSCNWDQFVKVLRIVEREAGTVFETA